MVEGLESGKSSTSSFTEDPGIDITYGEKTWVPRQSILDVVQNHLDANITDYEKKLLRAVGILSYTPNSQVQQELLTLLEHVRRGEIQQVRARLHSLLEQHAPSNRSVDDIAIDVRNVTQELPRLELKVSNGTKTQWMEYGGMSALPLEWIVQGFRMYDSGSGFDHQLLGMMGASTKKTSTGKRGGLGEGLKMSVAHLARSGVSIRMFSRNKDGTWIARPAIEGKQMMFQGKRKEEQRGEDDTGSITEVDFSVSGVNPALAQDWGEMLDPRKGEGLGRHVLEYRDERFLSMTNETVELCSLGLEHGRIYVKGLLVEEDPTLLFSYNIGDKWAISGRDRKTVRREALAEAVRTALENLSDPDRIVYLLAAISSESKWREVQTLGLDLHIPPPHQPLWRAAIEQVFRFSAGTVIFAPDDLPSDRARWAKERGYEIRRIPIACTGAIALFQNLYPGKTVSFAQLAFDSQEEPAAHVAQKKSTEERKKETQTSSDEPLPPEDAAFLEGIYNQFLGLLCATAEDELSHGVFRSLDVNRLQSLELAALPPSNRNNGSPFLYVKRKNTLYVSAGIPHTYQITLDAHLEFLKIVTGRDVFDTRTQDVLTRMAGLAVAQTHPFLRADLGWEGNVEDTKMVRHTTYSPEEKEDDILVIECKELANRINTQVLNREEVEHCLARMREIKQQRKNGRIPATIPNAWLQWEGKVYRINADSVELEEVDFSATSPPQTMRKRVKRSEEYIEFYLEGNMSLPAIEDVNKETPKTEETVQQIPSIQDEPHITADFRKKYLERRRAQSRRLFGGAELQALSSDTLYFSKDSAQPQKRLLAELPRQQLQPNEVSYLPTRIQDGDVLHMKLTAEKGDVCFLHIMRKKGKLIVTKQTERGTDQYLSPIGQSFSFADGSVSVFQSVIQIRSSRTCTLDIHQEKYTAAAQLPECNRGNNLLKTSVSVEYGKEVWNDPTRILLDAVQNHIDAQQQTLPSVIFTVVGPQNQLQERSAEQLRELGKEWCIIGVSIQDTGEGYTTPYLSILGSTTKDEENIGKFGEGLKMLTASALRQGIHIELASRDWKATPRPFEQIVKDYETDKEQSFTMLGYDLQWLDEPARGSKTHFALLPLQPGQQDLTPEQAAALEEKLSPRSTMRNTWENWIAVLDPRNANEHGQRGLARYVLEETPKHGNDIVTVLPSSPGTIYEKGLLVPADRSRPMLFGYNLDATIVNTRERNTYNSALFEKYVRGYYRNLADKEIIRAILVAARDHPGTDYFEYGCIGGDAALWRQTYYEVFGDDAVLSLQPMLRRLERILTPGPFSIMVRENEGLVRHYNQLSKVVSNEQHLEGNVRMLPHAMTTFLESHVYTSKNFQEALHASEMEVPADFRERLCAWVRETNEAVLETISALERDAHKADSLHAVVPSETLEERRQLLGGINAKSIKVKHRSFPALGYMEDKKNLVISLNEKILRSPRDLLDTYVHELAHYLSGKTDYVLDFQRFLMLLALSGRAGG